MQDKEGTTLDIESCHVGFRQLEISERGINCCNIDTLARIGLSFRLDSSFSELSWYGKGPWETYSDRKTAAFTGLYRSTVSEQHVRFVKP